MLGGMASNLSFDLPRLIAFYKTRHPLCQAENMAGIGWEKDGEIQATVIYEGINDFNCWMHCAAVPGRHWLNRTFLRAAFAYPFLVCKVRMVRGYVDASNWEARRGDEHLGFRVEAVLEGAAKDGGDVLIYVMHREECRYV